MWKCVCVCVCVCVSTWACVCMHSCMYMYVACVCVCTYMCMYIYMLCECNWCVQPMFLFCTWHTSKWINQNILDRLLVRYISLLCRGLKAKRPKRPALTMSPWLNRRRTKMRRWRRMLPAPIVTQVGGMFWNSLHIYWPFHLILLLFETTTTNKGRHSSGCWGFCDVSEAWKLKKTFPWYKEGNSVQSILSENSVMLLTLESWMKYFPGLRKKTQCNLFDQKECWGLLEKAGYITGVSTCQPIVTWNSRVLSQMEM